MTPELQAMYDWYQLGEFQPERYEGEERSRYLAAAKRIEREWDNERI